MGGDGHVYTRLLLTLNYVVTFFGPLLAAAAAAAILSARALLGCIVAACAAWVVSIRMDGSEYGTGRPDRHFSQHHWVFVRLREYLKLSLHRTDAVQSKLLAANPTKEGQAIMAFFPHGVNSDFRVLMDGLMYEAFPSLRARTLAASILFQLPGLRGYSLATSCVDAGRKTATRCLKQGFSLLLCPGGQDEQIEARALARTPPHPLAAPPSAPEWGRRCPACAPRTPSLPTLDSEAAHSGWLDRRDEPRDS